MSPIAKVHIVTEQQVKQLQTTGKCTGNSGEIQNNSARLEFVKSERKMSAIFQNMQLKKIKRTEKKTTDGSVMDEKFAFLFQTSFTMGHDLMINAWVLSSPVVVIVHGNQEPQSMATILWDNSFSLPTREGFAVPDRVPWLRLAEVLHMKCQVDNGLGLTTENMQFLCEKVFKRKFNDRIPEDLEITWQQFCKDLVAPTFTFWEWFYGAMKLTRDCFRKMWKNGLVVGFISKSRTEELLISCRPGTFILRFSESEVGESYLHLLFPIQMSNTKGLIQFLTQSKITN